MWLPPLMGAREKLMLVKSGDISLHPNPDHFSLVKSLLFVAFDSDHLMTVQGELMNWKIMTFAVLFASTAMPAQSAPPEIGYAKAGAKGDAIYLVESDGTRLTKIYQGRSTSRAGLPIESIAMRLRAEDPNGGGEVAFVEGTRGLKIQKHDENGQPEGAAYAVTVGGEPNCVIHDIDYRSDGTLLVATCTKVWTVAPGALTADSSALLENASLNAVSALGDALLYVDGNVLKRLDGTTTTPIATLNSPYFYLDATSSTAFLSDIRTFQTVAFSSPSAAAQGCTTAGMVEVSPDGSQILYGYRGWILVHSSNCSGSPFRLDKSPRSVAWRTN